MLLLLILMLMQVVTSTWVERDVTSHCCHNLMPMLMLMLMQVVTTSTEELREFLPAPALTICPTFGSMLFGFPRWSESIFVIQSKSKFKIQKPKSQFWVQIQILSDLNICPTVGSTLFGWLKRSDPTPNCKSEFQIQIARLKFNGKNTKFLYPSFVTKNLYLSSWPLTSLPFMCAHFIHYKVTQTLVKAECSLFKVARQGAESRQQCYRASLQRHWEWRHCQLHWKREFWFERFCQTWRKGETLSPQQSKKDWCRAELEAWLLICEKWTLSAIPNYGSFWRRYKEGCHKCWAWSQ